MSLARLFKGASLEIEDLYLLEAFQMLLSVPGAGARICCRPRGILSHAVDDNENGMSRVVT